MIIKRTSIMLVADILRLLRNDYSVGILKATVCFKTGIGQSRITRLLDYLVTNRFVKCTVIDSHNYYRITDKGAIALTTYENTGKASWTGVKNVKVVRYDLP